MHGFVQRLRDVPGRWVSGEGPSSDPRVYETCKTCGHWLSTRIFGLATVVLLMVGLLSAPARAAVFPLGDLGKSRKGSEAKTAPASNRLIAPKPGPIDGKLPAAFVQATPKSIADLKAMQQHVKDLVARVSPAVVAVEVGDGSGSAVIISADGLAVTAGHVAGVANRDVRFTFPDGKTAHGKTLGADEDNDIGLMRITSPGRWPFAPLGDLDHTKPGDWVLALGHPGGFDRTRSLVTRLGRVIRIGPGTLQTDCTISPGDSGGPLLDMYGRVIGIHSSISTSFAENFHIPITTLYEGWDTLCGEQKPAAQ